MTSTESPKAEAPLEPPEPPAAEPEVGPVGPPSMPKSPSPAVTRAVAVLDLLASAGHPLGITEIARTLGLAKSSTLNLCVTLEQSGLIGRRDGEYALGRKTVELGGAYLRGFNIVREFYRACSASQHVKAELAQIAALDGTKVLYLGRHEGRAPLRLSATIGDRFPASITAVGNILLAELSDEVIRDRYREWGSLPRWTENSVRSLDGLMAKIQATRERGYAIDDGETNPAVYGIAVLIPPRSTAEEPFALGCSFLKGQMSTERRDAVLAELRQIRQDLSNPMLIATPRAGDRTPDHRSDH